MGKAPTPLPIRGETPASVIQISLISSKILLPQQDFPWVEGAALTESCVIPPPSCFLVIPPHPTYIPSQCVSSLRGSSTF